MGLDTSHDAWHGPYGSFNSFRRFLASQIGVDLDKMEGFGGAISFETVTHKIKPLLDHSDCDGELSPGECKQIAEGLSDILREVHPNNEWLPSIEQFKDGCLLAYSNNETLEFR